MDAFTLIQGLGLWAGLKAMRLTLDPQLRRIAGVSAFLCAFGVTQSAIRIGVRLINV